MKGTMEDSEAEKGRVLDLAGLSVRVTSQHLLNTIRSH